jgi:hypothetical protein
VEPPDYLHVRRWRGIRIEAEDPVHLFQAMSSIVLSGDLFDSWSHGRRVGKLTHPSALIRVLARQSFLGANPADIFMALYLMTRPEASGVEASRSVKDFAERMKREEAKSHLEDEEDET